MRSLLGKIESGRIAKQTNDIDLVLRKRASPMLDVEGIRHK